MSRWADAFAALSRAPDTLDTVRHNGGSPARVSHCVHSVTAPPAGAGAVETPAEEAPECKVCESAASWSEAEAETTPVTLLAPRFGQDSAEGEPAYDQPSPARRGVVRHLEGRFEHFCAVCGAWGAFGFGGTAVMPGRWYCFQHRARA
jgi:hypothetical protein